MAPDLAYFGDVHHNPWNNYRLYGTVIVIVLTIVVAFGVKFVAIFAPFSLACVIISVICVFIGSFEASADRRPDVRSVSFLAQLHIPYGAHMHHFLSDLWPPPPLDSEKPGKLSRKPEEPENPEKP